MFSWSLNNFSLLLSTPQRSNEATENASIGFPYTCSPVLVVSVATWNETELSTFHGHELQDVIDVRDFNGQTGFRGAQHGLLPGP